MRIRYILFVISLLLFALVPPVRGNPIDGDFAIISLDFSDYAKSTSSNATALSNYYYDDDYVSGETYSLETFCVDSYCHIGLVSSEGDYVGIAWYGFSISGTVDPALIAMIKISSVDVCSQSLPQDQPNLNPFSGLSRLAKPQACPIISFMDRNIPFCSARDIASIVGSAFGLYLCIHLFI